MKYAVTGTGRCGTTFLMIIFTKLGLNTGFTEYEESRIKRLPCNSGYEVLDKDLDIIKSPGFLLRADRRDYIKKGYYIFILQRNFEEVTQSQKRLQKKDGGCIVIRNEETHPNRLSKLQDDFIDWCRENQIGYKVIDFHVMIEQPNYLYDILKPTGVIDNIDFNTFKSAWEYADNHQKRK